MAKTVVSVSLDKEDYLKLKTLSDLESRSMASYIRNAINVNWSTLTPLEKQIIKNKGEIKA